MMEDRSKFTSQEYMIQLFLLQAMLSVNIYPFMYVVHVLIHCLYVLLTNISLCTKPFFNLEMWLVSRIAWS